MINALNLSPACIKSLSAVEAVPKRSNQHEFNGVAQLKDILGNEKNHSKLIFLFGEKTVIPSQMLLGMMHERSIPPVQNIDFISKQMML